MGNTTEVESIINTMTTRKEKMTLVANILLDAEASEVIHPDYVEISTEDYTAISPEEMLAILQGFELIPNCLKLSYRHRYQSETELIADKEAYDSMMKLAEAAYPEIPNSRAILTQESLSIIDFTINFCKNFRSGLRQALDNDILKCTRKNLDEIALELIIKDKTLYIKIIADKKLQKLKSLDRSSVFLQFLRYAEKHQDESFKLADAVQHTGYKNYSLLMRLFKDPKIYQAFFRVNGDTGYLIANFKPTYKMLADAGTSIGEIKKILN